MKRLTAFLLIALAGVALGAAAQKLAWFPYVSDELNQSCQKTVFEWQVMANRIDTTPVPLNANFEIIKLEGEPKPQGLIVRAYLRPRDQKLVMPDSLHWQQFVDNLNGQMARQTRVFGIDGLDNIYLLLHIGDRLVSVRHGSECAILKPDATRQERLAAMAQVLAPPAATRP